MITLAEEPDNVAGEIVRMRQDLAAAAIWKPELDVTVASEVFEWVLLVIDAELVTYAMKLLESGLPLDTEDPVAQVLVRLHQRVNAAQRRGGR